MSLLMDIQTNRCWARVDFLATGEIVLHIPEECELPIRVLVSRGGRSTEYEPNSSEKPNNCEVKKYCDDCLYNDTCDSKEFFYACTSKATISKMEQVDEPRLTPNYCGACKHREVPCGDLPCDVCRNYSNYEPKCEPRKEQNFCGKCRYLYRDFKYGLSCYRLMDNEPCKYEERKDEPTISKMEQVEDEPQEDVPILTAEEWAKIKKTMPESRLILFDDDGIAFEPQTEREGE